MPKKDPSPYLHDVDAPEGARADELLAMLRECEGVTVQEIAPCQSVTVETTGKPAFVIIKEV